MSRVGGADLQLTADLNGRLDLRLGAMSGRCLRAKKEAARCGGLSPSVAVAGP